MKKVIAKTVGCILAATCVMGLASCGEGKTITIGYTDYAPMNYENEAGELVGFDTDLAKAIFKDLDTRYALS